MSITSMDTITGKTITVVLDEPWDAARQKLIEAQRQYDEAWARMWAALEKDKEIRARLEESSVKEISPGMYQIGKDGPITGIGGLEEFDRVLREKVKDEYYET